MKDDNPGFHEMDDDAVPVVPLTVDEWMNRDLPPPDRLLGEWLTTTSRVYVSADTGLGKTSLGMAITAHLGAGLDFLHWRCHRRARVLLSTARCRAGCSSGGSTKPLRGSVLHPQGARFLSKEDIEDLPAAQYADRPRLPDADYRQLRRHRSDHLR